MQTLDTNQILSLAEMRDKYFNKKEEVNDLWRESFKSHLEYCINNSKTYKQNSSRLSTHELKQNLKFLEEQLYGKINDAKYFEVKETDDIRKYQFETVNLMQDIALCGDNSLNSLAPDLFRLMEHSDSFIGTEVVNCIIDYMKISEYAIKLLHYFYKNYEYLSDELNENIIDNLGKILSSIKDKSQQKEIAKFLISCFEEDKFRNYKISAYQAILIDLSIKFERNDFEDKENSISEDETKIDWKNLQQFKKKYDL